MLHCRIEAIIDALLLYRTIIDASLPYSSDYRCFITILKRLLMLHYRIEAIIDASLLYSSDYRCFITVSKRLKMLHYRIQAIIDALLTY